jgi:hypothetical protein
MPPKRPLKKTLDRMSLSGDIQSDDEEYSNPGLLLLLLL